MSSNLIVNNIEVGAGATIYTAASNQLAFGTNGSEKLRITSAGRVGINTNNPTEILDVRGDLVVAESLAVNRPRIVLSAPNDGTNFRHLFGANLQVNSSGTFTTPTANISGGGWEYLPANSLNAHGSIRYLSAPDTNATTSTPVERLRINANGDIVTQGLTDHSFNNDNANAKILEMTGDGTVGEYGSINVSGNQNADGSNIGSIKFVNRENSNSSSSSNAGSRVVAGLQAYIETSDTNAGDDSGGYLKFLTKSESGGLGERLRIKSDGTVYTYTEGAKFGVSQDPTLTTMGSTSGTWQLPEVDGQTIGAEMRIGDINSNSTALIRLASYGSGNSGTAGGAIMFTNTRCGSASHHSDLAAIKGARESLGKGYLRFFTASSAANTEKMRITADGEVLIGGRSAWGSNQHPNDANKVVITGPTPTDTYRNILMLEGSETNGAINTGGSLAFGGHDGNNNRNWANIWGMKENGTGGNTAGYMAFHTRPAGGNPTERLRIKSDGKIGINVTDPKSQLHLYGPSDLRIGSLYGGVALLALQVEYASGYTGTHFIFEITDQASYSFEGSHIVHGSGGSSYGIECTVVRMQASREAGATDSGDTWRNGTVKYNNNFTAHDQVGLNPGAGTFSFTYDDAATTTTSQQKMSFSASGQSVGVWAKLSGVFTWATTSTNGRVKIKDKDGNVLWDSNP